MVRYVMASTRLTILMIVVALCAVTACERHGPVATTAPASPTTKPAAEAPRLRAAMTDAEIIRIRTRSEFDEACASSRQGRNFGYNCSRRSTGHGDALAGQWRNRDGVGANVWRLATRPAMTTFDHETYERFYIFSRRRWLCSPCLVARRCGLFRYWSLLASGCAFEATIMERDP